MDGFTLTNQNYYSEEANKLYLSNSLFKALYGHPAHPIACEEAGLFTKPESEALFIGSYIDAYFEGPDEFEDFCKEHQDQIMQKSGKAKYKFVSDADETIKKITQDPVFMKFMGGDHQTIMTGEIANQPFKIKMDAYHKDEMIVDLKYVKSSEPVYNPFLKKYVTFIEDYGYYVQGAIYQEIVYQNTGKKLPFYIAYATKETVPDFGVVKLDQDKLDEALEYVKTKLLVRPYSVIKAHPERCGRRDCKYCKEKRKLSGPMTYAEFEAYIS